VSVTKPPPVYTSGFCVRDRHDHCKGAFPGVVCDCRCHRPEEDEPEPEPEPEPVVVHRWTDPPIHFDGRTMLDVWVQSLPVFEGRRPMMTADGYLNLLRHMLAGGSVPYYTSPSDLLSDAMLACTNERLNLGRRAEIAEASAAVHAPAIGRLWSLVLAAGQRKTMLTAEVREALEGGRG
jgi:hypothetical protein